MFAGASLAQAEEVTRNAMLDAYAAWPLLEDRAAWWVRLHAIRDYVDNAERGQRAPGVGAGERERVLAALGNLSLMQRMVAALSLDGHLPSKIALMLGRPTTYVTSNLRHAWDRLYRGLENASSHTG
jgi:hypothetical protein